MSTLRALCDDLFEFEMKDGFRMCFDLAEEILSVDNLSLVDSIA